MNNNNTPDTLDATAAQADPLLTNIEEPENSLTPLTLAQLPPKLRVAVDRAGWPGLMPVQSLAIPYLLAARDIMVQSRTGSGKTGAFLLPALERLDPARKECQAMILTPTRELTLQIEHEAGIIFKDAGLRTVAVYGGVGYGKQIEALHAGAQIIVGTPGRILDHLQSRNFTLDALRMLILDEADRMLSIGFYPDMKDVQRYLPKRRVPVHFFSATYPAQVLRVAKEFMPDPAMLSLSHNEVHIAGMEHIFYSVRTMEKDRALTRIIELESPSAAIIFCNTKANVHYVTAVLQGFGYNADELSADLSQGKREEVLKAMRHGDIRFLVATDVAARGIDIPELSHVILYEPPEDQESYIHRAGRTGRAGAGGTVISLVDVMEQMELQRIGKHYKIELKEKVVPSDEIIAQVVGERLTALLEGRLRKVTVLQKERLQRFVPLAAQLAQEENALALLALLLDEQYHASLHAKIPGLAIIDKEDQQEDKHEHKDRSGNRGTNNNARSRNNRPKRTQGGKPDARPDTRPDSRPGAKPGAGHAPA
ncbi:MAG: DEAD/DEAH box helicase [Deltaproteobacteria bacterium]|jgi:ATP-dependent RNA helicase DeaD|nr:DEAD/DEAH box helicase [Deltaproteobacteria bacterium]